MLVGVLGRLGCLVGLLMGSLVDLVGVACWLVGSLVDLVGLVCWLGCLGDLVDWLFFKWEDFFNLVGLLVGGLVQLVGLLVGWMVENMVDFVGRSPSRSAGG